MTPSKLSPLDYDSLIYAVGSTGAALDVPLQPVDEKTSTEITMRFFTAASTGDVDGRARCSASVRTRSLPVSFSGLAIAERPFMGAVSAMRM
ncbi:hypothetical protein AWC01_03175 [Mycobacterium doricum]|nr:hypothetical protein AWC01_03175 [Mycolicibacterium doricum]